MVGWCRSEQQIITPGRHRVNSFAETLEGILRTLVEQECKLILHSSHLLHPHATILHGDNFGKSCYGQGLKDYRCIKTSTGEASN